MFLCLIEWNTCPASQMKERADGNALSFGLQTMGILLVRLFPLIVRMKPTDAVVIFPSVLAQSVNQTKPNSTQSLYSGAMSTPRCSISRMIRSTSSSLLSEARFGAGSNLGNVGTLFSKGTFSQSWAENIFFDIFVVFRVNVCLWIVRQETGTCHIASRHIHHWQARSTDTVGNSLEKP